MLLRLAASYAQNRSCFIKRVEVSLHFLHKLIEACIDAPSLLSQINLKFLPVSLDLPFPLLLLFTKLIMVETSRWKKWCASVNEHPRIFSIICIVVSAKLLYALYHVILLFIISTGILFDHILKSTQCSNVIM